MCGYVWLYEYVWFHISSREKEGMKGEGEQVEDPLKRRGRGSRAGRSNLYEFLLVSHSAFEFPQLVCGLYTPNVHLLVHHLCLCASGAHLDIQRFQCCPLLVQVSLDASYLCLLLACYTVQLTHTRHPLVRLRHQLLQLGALLRNAVPQSDAQCSFVTIYLHCIYVFYE